MVTKSRIIGDEYFSTIKTTDHKAYVFYRENSKFCNRKDIKDFVDYGKILRQFYEIASDMLVESKNGMYIEDLGYFGFLRYNETKKRSQSRFFKFAKNLMYKDSTYYIAFIPITRNKIARCYLFDKAYTVAFKKKVKDKLKQGYHYKFSVSPFLQYIKGKNRRFKF